MNKKVLRSSIISCILGLGTFAIPNTITAENSIATDECAKELLLFYFPEPIVTETLKKFNIPEDKWTTINQILSRKDKEVVKLVEQKASALNPNPLKDPQQRQAAVKLFRDTLLQVFSEALKESGLQDSSQFQAMLDDIQQQKAKKFALCMEKQKTQIQQSDKDRSKNSHESGKDKLKDSDESEDEDDEDNDEEENESDLDHESKNEQDSKNHHSNKDHSSDKNSMKTSEDKDNR